MSSSIITPILEVVFLIVPVLLTVAYVTVAERKTMASMQRRLGPNAVGYYGLLQAFADALKLLLKEYVAPSQANIILFFIGPIVTLIFSLLAYAVVPYGPGITVFNFDLGIIYLLAVSSLSTYGILLAGWSANSKYAFLGSLRSTAQLISYELILTSAILLVVLLTGSLNLVINVEAQRAIWFIFPLLPVFIIFFIGSVAETNRAPFDLAEAESELVSGFMTEHSAVIFVFFFLAEYASIVFMCVLTSLFFLGGYLYNVLDLFYPIYEYIYSIVYNCIHWISSFGVDSHSYSPNPYDQFTYANSIKAYYNTGSSLSVQTEQSYFTILIQALFYSLSLGLKTCVMVFTFIWVRASFPRIRYDQLMSYCWTILLPIVVSFIIILPCILYSFDILPVSIAIL